jgi:8-oxo-dGTP pyrophosphatase MutT (NUDIX family)
VVDPAGRVLLFGYDDPPPRGQHWATPGGGLEDDEDFHAAACRELAEETGWGDVPVSPAEVHTDSGVFWSGYFRGLVRQDDHFFVARVATERRPLDDVAAMHASDGIIAHRWWTLAELEATSERVYPVGLAGLLRRLAG